MMLVKESNLLVVPGNLKEKPTLTNSVADMTATAEANNKTIVFD